MNPSDAGPGGSTSALPCGATTCAIPSQACCVEQTNGGVSYSCTAAGGACGGADAGPGGGNGGNTTALECSSAANCAPGTVCCVQQVNNTIESSCQASCAGGAQLCDPTAAPTGCSPSQPCSNQNIGDWGLPKTYGTCGGTGN